MISAAYCPTLARYNAWMNGKLIGLCAGLPDEERKRDLHAFFRSVHGTLDHILACDAMFMSHFTKGTPRHMCEGAFPEDFAALARRRDEMDEEILAWSGSISQPWLDTPSRYIHDDGQPRIVTNGFWAVHMFNHQTHHRGQVTTLLTQLGHDIGATDLHCTRP